MGFAPAAEAQITPSDRLTSTQVSSGTGEMRDEGLGQRDSFGVASFNVCVCLRAAQARQDAARLASIPGLKVIGWQEANVHAGVYSDLPGWTTVHDLRTATKAHELAVSWRTRAFELVSYRYVRMHLGSSALAGDSTPFPPRFLLEVQLRSTRSPGDVLTVYNTHTNQRVERWDDRAPGKPYVNLNADGARAHLRAMDLTLAARALDPERSRWAVVLGDLNWDFVADQRTLLPRFVEGRVGEWAVSGWESLGVAGTGTTHPRSRRRIDYVLLTRDSAAHFRSQAVRTGYFSDHRPVVARLGLN
jgi:endonuclease/exonuclease/phosphatase family metal-dependent hydrolase